MQKNHESYSPMFVKLSLELFNKIGSSRIHFINKLPFQKNWLTKQSTVEITSVVKMENNFCGIISDPHHLQQTKISSLFLRYKSFSVNYLLL